MGRRALTRGKGSWRRSHSNRQNRVTVSVGRRHLVTQFKSNQPGAQPGILLSACTSFRKEWEAQDVAHPPQMVGQTRRHGR